MTEDQSLFALLKLLSADEWLCLLFSIGCTLWLLISRIRGCFHPTPINVGRDFAFLITGPVTAILITTIRSIAAVESNMTVGIDSDVPLRYGLATATAYCTVALLCFILGVISFMLPAKDKTD